MANSIAEQIKALHNEQSRQAEELLFEISRENRTPSYEEATFLRSTGLNDVQINDELRRVARVIRLQQIAGTSADRKKLDDAARAAEEKLLTEGAKIEDQIAKLEKQLNVMRADVKDYTTRREQIDRALDNLRLNCSRERMAEYKASTRTIGDTIKREALDLEVEVSHIENLLNTRENDRLWLELVRAYDHKSVENDPHHQGRLRLTHAWTKQQHELSAKLGPMKEKLAELQAQVADEEADAEELLREYFR